MEPPVERIRLSQMAKDQLVKLKRYTKIDQWNILCRWAFCYSLAESTRPSPIPLKLDSNLEMSWPVFSGNMGNILIVALKQRCRNDGLDTDPETLSQQFLLHLHRGIGYLAGNPRLKKIDDLVGLVEE